MAKNKAWIIEDVHLLTAGAKGAAIAKPEGQKTIMVCNGVPGDVVDVRIVKKKKRFLEGKVVTVKKASADRIEPNCQHFGICGGCKWQNMTYEKQLFYKEQEVRDHLERIAKIQPEEFLPILGSEQQFWYRNKMEFSFSNQRWVTEEEIKEKGEIENRNALGFHIPGMWSKILDIEKCWLQEEPSNQIRRSLKEFADEQGLAFFDPTEQSGLLRTLMIRMTTTGEIMVLVQFFENQPENIQKVLGFLNQKFPEITSLLYTINPKGNDSIYDLEILNFKGQDFITEEMEGLRFKIGPKSFYQTNPQQALHLYQITRDFADLDGSEIVYDLYTGTGTIAQFIAQKAKKVIGVESVPEAIVAARENAAFNQIDNCTFYVGDMKNVFTDAFVQENGYPDVIVVDPPRDGMHPKVVENLLNIAPEKIVYVSCNSATQARDLEKLKEKYTLKKVQPVDMFPQTYHVENVALLTLKK
ncbi:23S rRNA (uracil-C(5))-methyltransferase RlmCD [Candidatus Ornithobacterium hominis]|uniref:23S rRNA (Uracil-C(5))-methyltransferase RlmCD n=1 Tax=Candidatus Ornithobacterium hominis TaxID=2497989 RepID=A0A383U318_9FLAO|nr:23S rRNA (uracil(1939)-C(5))-methyltransferase RlmD [Candidatus Ornithobacterium hominis]MCT7905162.1 23S rRNA (uracil(1939)-C(5))-methyltransferase RlmD [Candidatus Ornithobacterium hominis]SZD74235.1 23S rRNA (uracil-C(5))-methyltransferase RlmCD [Candidatus Ornithobacterium hominis]